MKRIGLLLTLLILLLTACGSGGTPVTEQAENEEPTAEATSPAASNETAETESTAVAPADDGQGDDPTLARERDWKLGNVVDPAVTIIEYGDFQ